MPLAMPIVIELRLRQSLKPGSGASGGIDGETLEDRRVSDTFRPRMGSAPPASRSLRVKRMGASEPERSPNRNLHYLKIGV